MWLKISSGSGAVLHKLSFQGRGHFWSLWGGDPPPSPPPFAHLERCLCRPIVYHRDNIKENLWERQYFAAKISRSLSIRKVNVSSRPFNGTESFKKRRRR